jgi:hypothetical protein
MVRLPAQVTVVRGRDDNRIDVEVTNHSAESQSGKVGLEVPEGWKLEEKQVPFSVPARRTAVVTFRCTVPADAVVKSHDVAVRLGDATDAGKLDVVPALAVGRLAAALPVDADPAKWEQAGVKPVAIPPGNLLGSFGGPGGNGGECSGKFYVGYTDDGLQVLVDVTDNTVAHNIAPDDIKAHWRSTSVEICVDPTLRSENTFSTLKLGIFPEDTTGKVQAARDADARQGELHKIGSKIQLASHRKETGYLVEARIPWSEIGVRDAARPGQLGFNVILYHAGKKDARVGEDIGKSRLAWSPWSGVPGRPEVWGLAVCE